MKSVNGSGSAEAGWAAVQVLADRTRRAIFDAVRAARGPVTREQVADTVGVQRGLAAFHLDRLADAGLVEVSYARPPGRTGRGAGRPAKRYDATNTAITVALPPQNTSLLGTLLARAVAERPTCADEHAADLAEAEGRRLGELRRPAPRINANETLRVVGDVLTDLGYEPEASDTAVRLRNCPFHDVMQAAPELVCAMNTRMVRGLLTGLGGSSRVTAELEPTPGDCCVTVATRKGRARR
jgi:predicted ArsR family transcriptional regulator